jgi:hypothetical protein
LILPGARERPWDLDDRIDENRFTTETWGPQMKLRATRRRSRSATARTRAAGRPENKPSYGFRYARVSFCRPITWQS